MLGMLGKKIGMTQIFEDGKLLPVTVVQVEKNYILQKKTVEKEGYNAIQVGTDEKREKNTTKSLNGIFKKAGVAPQRFIKEFKVDGIESYELGKEISLDMFSKVGFLDITGISKGKGFQGTVKRHNFTRQPQSHGAHNVHRKPGSIGQSSSPSKVMKGMRMSGRMGGERVTVQNLRLVKVDTENSILLVKGAVPGPKNGHLIIKPAVKK